MEITPTTDGFEGAIQIQNRIASAGARWLWARRVTASRSAWYAEHEVSFAGIVSGDRTSGSWNDGARAHPPHDGFREAVRTAE